jgi:hypothetical protein
VPCATGHRYLSYLAPTMVGNSKSCFTVLIW